MTPDVPTLGCAWTSWAGLWPQCWARSSGAGLRTCPSCREPSQIARGIADGQGDLGWAGGSQMASGMLDGQRDLRWAGGSRMASGILDGQWDPGDGISISLPSLSSSIFSLCSDCVVTNFNLMFCVSLRLDERHIHSTPSSGLIVRQSTDSATLTSFLVSVPSVLGLFVGIVSSPGNARCHFCHLRVG